MQRGLSGGGWYSGAVVGAGVGHPGPPWLLRCMFYQFLCSITPDLNELVMLEHRNRAPRLDSLGSLSVRWSEAFLSGVNTFSSCFYLHLLIFFNKVNIYMYLVPLNST